ncbi:hypothetical protein CRT60_34530 [Azospirillum palustre]|uniref:Uncharacterized protein n=1 Tax=Azospirillum palustre TaxID=2044885 RepID=A0A2B8BAN6_9PROT|nr:hypothetical protein [Azospirillum palustre]PGH54850.1 hypothetical protein CRT60_34530 [Azospirillum palustre]
MPPIERARRLSRSLQARFRIDLFSALVEREFERRLADTIVEAERDAYRRGREEAQAGLATGAVSPVQRPEAAVRPDGPPMTM